MKFAATFTGLQEAIQGLTLLPRELPQEQAKTLYRDAEEVMTTAKEETPVDTGALRASGHVQLRVIEGTTVSVEIGFGGPAGAGNVGGETNKDDVGYAEIVHENLDAHHSVGKAKYLEDPVRAAQPQIAQDLTDAGIRTLERLGLK